MSPKLSLITTCKGRLHYLRQTLPEMTKQEHVECVVVDYGCPQGTGDWVAEHFPQVKVVRVKDDPGFNQCRARNLGAVAATSSLFCFVDADIRLAPEFASWIGANCAAKTFLRAQPVTMDTWGTFACNREDFWRVGGYDEIYEGYGASPEDLYLRLSNAGTSERGFPATLISSIPNSEAERTAFYATSNRWWQHRINSLYLIAKLDLIKLLEEGLSIEQKKALYAQSRQAIVHAMNSSSNFATLEVSLEDKTTRTMNILIHLDRKLTYSIRWSNPSP
jgi:glycosyltransferase involved in cell wall biosynthesis